MPERRPRRTYTDEFKMQLVQLYLKSRNLMVARRKKLVTIFFNAFYLFPISIVSNQASIINSIVFCESDEGREIFRDNLEADLVGCLILNNKADEFEMAFNAFNVSEGWSEFPCLLYNPLLL